MMKNEATFLHIICKGSYASKYMSFVGGSFSGQNHVFLIIDDKYETKFFDDPPNKSFIFLKIRNLKDLLMYLRQYVPHSNHIFVHSLFFHPKILITVKILLRMLKNTRNFSWVLWGNELYNYYMKTKHSPTEWLYKELRKLFVRDAYSIIALMEEDYHFARQKFRTKAKYSYAFYPNIVSFEDLDQAIARTEKEKHTKKILIGNSATETNNHFEVLQSLKKLNIPDNFEIVCPLSYGDKEYATRVINYGKSLYGERFKALTQLLPPEEYSLVLSDVNVAIFNYKRQQGMGNIIALLYLGKKVYLRSDSPIWNFANRYGLKVFDTIKIVNGDENDLFAFQPSLSETNRKIVKAEFSNERCRELWRSIFAEHV